MKSEVVALESRFKLTTLAALIVGFCAGRGRAAQSQGELLLQGPVDKVNVAKSEVEVLGQWVTATGIPLNTIQGSVVAVAGTIDARGAYVVSRPSTELASVAYVEGSTPSTSRQVSSPSAAWRSTTRPRCTA